MVEKIVSKVSHLLVGLSIGALIGILFAPKSGKETRRHLTQKAKRASEYAQEKALEQKERAEDLIRHGKQVITQKKQQIATAVEVGR